MSEADYTKAVIIQAIEQATTAQTMVQSQLDQAYTELQANVNSVRQSIEYSQRVILATIAKQRQARAEADSVVMGATGLVAEAIMAFNQNEDDLTEAVQNLHAMKQDIERMQSQIVGKTMTENRKIAGRMVTAIVHLRNYWSVL